MTVSVPPRKKSGVNKRVPEKSLPTEEKLPADKVEHIIERGGDKIPADNP